MNQSLTFAAMLAMLMLAGCAANKSANMGGGNGPLDESAIVRLADRMRSQGDVTMAADFYQRAIERSPDYMPAYLGLATLYEQVGQTEQATHYYLEAIKRDGGNAAVRRAYAKLLLSQGQYNAAAEQYQVALKGNADDDRALNGLGVAYDQMGKHAKAQEQYRRVLRMDRDNLTALGNFGLSLIAVGDAKGAIAKMAPAADSLKVTPSLRQNLALAYVMTGQEEKARKLLRRDLGSVAADKIIAQLQKQHSTGSYRKPGLADDNEPVKVATVQQLDIEPLPSIAVEETKVEEPLSERQKVTVADLPSISWSHVKKSRGATSKEIKVEPPKTVKKKSVAHKKILKQAQEQDGPGHKKITLIRPKSNPEISNNKPLKALFARVAPHVYADRTLDVRAIIGPFATDAMASVQASVIKKKFSGYLPKHKVLNVATRLSQGGTPQFFIGVYGFEEYNEAADFCDHISRRKYSCEVR